jgi:hypothetical protein
MTMQIYDLQYAAAFSCYEAKKDLFEECGIICKAEAIGQLALARIFSFGCLLKSLSDVFIKTGFRVAYSIVQPLVRDGFSFKVLVRQTIALALLISATALRILCSLGGVISPELTFGVFKLHRFLLLLGLIRKSQFSTNRIFARLAEVAQNPLIAQLLNRVSGLISNDINDQGWRWKIVSHAMQKIEESETAHTWFTREDYKRIWETAEREALVEELAPLLENARTLLEQFFQPVRVAHPDLDQFLSTFSTHLHSQALMLCREHIYSKDEIEDMMTCIEPVMYRATCSAIKGLFQRGETELSLRNRDVRVTELELGDGQIIVLKDVVLADGNCATVKEAPLSDGQIMRSVVNAVPIGRPRNIEQRRLHDGEKIVVDDLIFKEGGRSVENASGGLEQWKQKLLEIVILLNGMSAEAEKVLLDDLCHDEPRISRVHTGFRPIAERPSHARCANLIVEFVTTTISRRMQEDSTKLQKALTLDEIPDGA